MSQANEPRQAILISMAFQIGFRGLLGFSSFLAAMRKEDYLLASLEMLNSKWAKKDSPARALRHSKVVLDGDWSEYKELI